ncbi:MAG: QueT transporter family protein [Clostridiales bacterium]|nr:QueT transporter family protein [Clostridiales bacterium]
MKNLTVRKLTFIAVIGALYTALTVALAPISYGPVQFRISEVLCILPFFYPSTMWGLFVGCALSNLFGGYGPLDIVFGSLATLAAGFCTSKIRFRPLALLPVVLFNAVVVGAVIAWSSTPGAFWAGFTVNAFQIGLAEFGVMYIIGLPLLYILPRYKFFNKLRDALA